MLADGIAYALILDSIHQGAVNLTRLNLAPRYPEDNLRNCRLIEDALKKLKINQPVDFHKMAHAKFQDNITFLQWLFAYYQRHSDQAEEYPAYEKRVNILLKQGKEAHEMNPHLVPNQAFMQENEWQAGMEGEQDIDPQAIQDRLGQLSNQAKGMENYLREKMEANWKLMHFVDRSIEERNHLYGLMSQIEEIVASSPDSPLSRKLLQIIHQKPQDYEMY